MKYLRVKVMLTGLLIGAIASAQGASVTRTTAFEYGPATGLLDKEIVEPDNIQLRLETAYTYDAYGNNIGTLVTSPATGTAAIASRSSSAIFDARGQFPISNTNALGQSETLAIDPRFGVMASLTGPNSLKTQWEYDSFGRKKYEYRADNTKVRWDYLYCNGVNGGTATCPSLAKFLIQTNQQNIMGAIIGPWFRTYYDALGREIGTETLGFDGVSIIKTSTTYDSLGRVYQVSRPYYSTQTPVWTTTAYDALGRVTSVTQPDHGQTTFTYNGLTSTTRNALNQPRTLTRDSRGQLVKVTDALNNSLVYQYDPSGNLKVTTDPKGNSIQFDYDIRGRKKRMIDPDMGTWSYEYDVLDELVQQTDAKGQLTTLQYDVLGRLTGRAEPDLKSTWTFDACTKGIGKLCKAKADNGYASVMGYDSLGRLNSTTTTIDVSYTTGRTFDDFGRVATQTYPGGLVIKYVYSPLGDLQEVRNNASNVLYWKANTVDAEGRLLQQTYGNNVVTEQVYDPLTGRLQYIYAGTGKAVQNLAFTYDLAGSLISRVDTNQNLSESFLYDSLRRLTSNTVNSNGAGIVTQNYAYNSIGNFDSRSDMGNYTYGAGGVRPHGVSNITLVGGGRRAYLYDANGNLTSEVQYDAANNVISGKGRTETYTSFNMPIALGTPGATLTFTYGPEHQRTKQIAPDTTTIYLHPDNAGGLSYEKDIKSDTSIEQRNFITAGGQVVAVVKQTNTGTTVRYLHQDYLGSVSAVTDEAGAVVERFAYEPFGKRRSADGIVDPNNLIKGVNTDRGYTMHEHLDALGLIHMNGRVYDPAIGRFMSADPDIPHPLDIQSFNRYGYTRNNPLAYVDPSGFSDYTILPPVIIVGEREGLGYSLQIEQSPTVGVGIVQSALNYATRDYVVTNNVGKFINGNNWNGNGNSSYTSIVGRKTPTSDSPNTAGAATATATATAAARATAVAGSLQMAGAGGGTAGGLIGGGELAGLGAAAGNALAGGAAVGAILSLPGSEAIDEKMQYIYATYTRVHPITGEVYSGRTGGYGDPETLVQERGRQQGHLNAEKFGPPVLDKWSTDRSAIRGREQQLIDYYGGARSVGGTTRNMINGVADFNPSRYWYMSAAIAAFDSLPDNSPSRRKWGP